MVGGWAGPTLRDARRQYLRDLTDVQLLKMQSESLSVLAFMVVRALCNRDSAESKAQLLSGPGRLDFGRASQVPNVPCLIRARASSIARRSRKVGLLQANLKF